MDVRIEVPVTKDAVNVAGHNLAGKVCIFRDDVWYSGSFMVLPRSVWGFLAREAKSQGKVLYRVKVLSEEVEEVEDKKEKKARGPKVVKKSNNFNPFMVGE